jgi:anaerobic ribonucleoside-triphosphate reductase
MSEEYCVDIAEPEVFVEKVRKFMHDLHLNYYTTNNVIHICRDDAITIQKIVEAAIDCIDECLCKPK